MKKLLVLMIAVLSLNAFAESEVTRGYVYENERKDLYYSGFNDNGEKIAFDLDFASRSGEISDDEIQSMFDCMNLKETHAILLVRESSSAKVPTGIPGRYASAHYSSVTSVECVRAPGFLKTWRIRMGATY